MPAAHPPADGNGRDSSGRAQRRQPHFHWPPAAGML